MNKPKENIKLVKKEDFNHTEYKIGPNMNTPVKLSKCTALVPKRTFSTEMTAVAMRIVPVSLIKMLYIASHQNLQMLKKCQWHMPAFQLSV